MQYTIILSGSVKHSVSCIKLLLTEGDAHEEVDLHVKKTTREEDRRRRAEVTRRRATRSDGVTTGRGARTKGDPDGG
jgi:hypothetical protein